MAKVDEWLRNGQKRKHEKPTWAVQGLVATPLGKEDRVNIVESCMCIYFKLVYISRCIHQMHTCSAYSYEVWSDVCNWYSIVFLQQPDTKLLWFKAFSFKASNQKSWRYRILQKLSDTITVQPDNYKTGVFYAKEIAKILFSAKKFCEEAVHQLPDTWWKIRFWCTLMWVHCMHRPPGTKNNIWCKKLLVH